MRAYLICRLISILVVWLGVTILTFLIANVVPVDPVALRLGPKANPVFIAFWRHEYGLDQSLPMQYVHFINGVLHLDLGTSIWSGRPIINDLKDYLPATLELAFISMLGSFLIGIPLGAFAANTKTKFLDGILYNWYRPRAPLYLYSGLDWYFSCSFIAQWISCRLTAALI